MNQGVVFSYLLHCEDLSDSSCYDPQRTVTINSAFHDRNPGCVSASLRRLSAR